MGCAAAAGGTTLDVLGLTFSPKVGVMAKERPQAWHPLTWGCSRRVRLKTGAATPPRTGYTQRSAELTRRSAGDRSAPAWNAPRPSKIKPWLAPQSAGRLSDHEQHRRVGDFPVIKRGTLVAKRPPQQREANVADLQERSAGGSDEGPAPHRSCELRTFEPNGAPNRNAIASNRCEQSDL